MTKHLDPSLVGVGLRPTHYPYLEEFPQIVPNFFEAISENYMNTEGRPLEMLLKVRSRFPVALHGVSLSIGSEHGLNVEYLNRLKKLVDRVDPIIISDHLCWGQTPRGNTHDLLPIPLTREVFRRIATNVDQVQNFLGRQILLENISYYLRFKQSEVPETEFLSELCKQTGCEVLLDLNNVFVNAINHGFNPADYIDAISPQLIGQFHIAGHSEEPGYLFDTHSTIVRDEVWKLLDRVAKKNPRTPLIVEWDQNIPEFSILEKEAITARDILTREREIHAQT